MVPQKNNTERQGDMMYQMAAYCRLSKDDGENKISESIENQLKLIREYVRRSGDCGDLY